MNELKKKRIKTVLKYTWPFYILSAVLLGLSLYIIFGVTHRAPAYKTLTIFISGEVTNATKMKKDLREKFKDKELKYITCISASPSAAIYDTKFSVSGINSADILIVATPKLNETSLSPFALELSDELINSYYQGMSFYQKDENNFGVKIDKEKVKEYMTLPNEDCYMLINAKSQNIGEYSTKQIKEHNTALLVVQEWGI